MDNAADRVIAVDHKYLKKQLRDFAGLDPDYAGLLRHLGAEDSMFADLPLQPRTKLLVYDAPPYASPGWPGVEIAAEEAAMVAKAEARWAEVERLGGEVRKGRCFRDGRGGFMRKGAEVLMAVDALSRFAEAEEFDFFAGGFEIAPILQALVEDGVVVRVWGTAKPALPDRVEFVRITAGVAAEIGRPLTAAPGAAKVLGMEVAR